MKTKTLFACAVFILVASLVGIVLHLAGIPSSAVETDNAPVTVQEAAGGSESADAESGAESIPADSTIPSGGVTGAVEASDDLNLLAYTIMTHADDDIKDEVLIEWFAITYPDRGAAMIAELRDAISNGKAIRLSGGEIIDPIKAADIILVIEEVAESIPDDSGEEDATQSDLAAWFDEYIAPNVETFVSAVAGVLLAVFALLRKLRTIVSDTSKTAETKVSEISAAVAEAEKEFRAASEKLAEESHAMMDVAKDMRDCKAAFTADQKTIAALKSEVATLREIVRIGFVTDPALVRDGRAAAVELEDKKYAENV